MKISDKGLNHILSLGFFSSSEQESIYSLYQWDGITYFAGSESLEKSFDQDGVYISLSLDQLNLLPIKKEISKIVSVSNTYMNRILDLYESAVFLEYNDEEKVFKTAQFDGLLVNLNHLNINSEVPSPFSIIKKTKAEYHGFYSSLNPLDKTLSDLGVDTSKLWMTGVAVMKKDQFKGVLLGVSTDQEYGLDTLDIFKDCANELAQSLEDNPQAA